MTENNVDKLSMKIRNESNQKASAAELRKVVVLLMCHCQSVEHGNNVSIDVWKCLSYEVMACCCKDAN